MPTKERWVPVREKGFEKLYEVSDAGRIRSLHNKKPRILKPSPNANGFMCVNLSRNGKAITKRLSVLVAEAFLGKRPKGYVIQHIDFVHANDSLDNLRFVKFGRIIKERAPTKVARPNALSRGDYDRIHQMRKSGMTLAAIAKEIGCSLGHVSRIVNGVANHPRLKDPEEMRAKRRASRRAYLSDPETRERHREFQRKYQRKYRENMTEEQRKKRREYMREYMRKRKK